MLKGYALPLLDQTSLTGLQLTTGLRRPGKDSMGQTSHTAPGRFPAWELSISLARTTVAPPADARWFARVVGGPNDLLVWMESQLGLHAPTDVPLRLAVLKDVMGSGTRGTGSSLAIAASFKDHPYAVVGRVLEHRDSFLMAVPPAMRSASPAAGGHCIPDIDTCGLAAARDADLPEVIQQYAAVMAPATEAQRATIASGEPDRLANILAAFADGQRLPACHITIGDDPTDWPGRWRALLEDVRAKQPQCTITWSPPLPPAQAAGGAALRTVQDAIDPGFASQAIPAITEDESLRTIRCASVATASQAAAVTLKNLSPPELAVAVVVCEDDTTAALIDGHLHAFALPTMGNAASSQASDIHAMLPLVIEAVATPAHPGRIKELLTLSDSPVPWRARWHLKKAIDDLPAVGSPAWTRALSAIGADPADGAKTVATVNEWIPIPPSGAPASGGFDPTAVAQAVARLADWANKRAQGIKDDIRKRCAAGLPNVAEDAAIALDSVRRAHYQSLHAACRAFNRLLASRMPATAAVSPPATISRTEYLQLLDAVRPSQPTVALHPESAGGPRRVRSFAEIDATEGGPRHVIWVGTNTIPAARSRWIHADIERMRNEHGVDLDAPGRQLVARRRAERAGLRQISGSLLVIAHPSQDSEGRPHPFWMTISEMLYAGETSHTGSAYEPKLVDPTEPEFPITPWCISRTATPLVSRPLPVDQIHLPPQVALPARKMVSYSEATKRLTCPVAWTFDYGSGIHAPLGAGLKNASALAGSAAEQVIREVFESSPPANVTAALAKLDTVLATRLPFIHAGICQPGALSERKSFEETLRKAVPVMQCLIDGGVTVSFGADVGAFVDAAGNALSWNGSTPAGAIDVLGSMTVNGRTVPLVIDEKLGGASTYKQLLKDARCWQLVLYADLAGRKGTATPVDAIGYLVLSEGKLYVPSWAAGELGDARFAGYVDVINGSATASLAEQAAVFQSQVGAASKQMHQPGAVIPAHPRVAARGGPLHDDLALVHGVNPRAAAEDACKYCDYGVLCGKDEVR